MEDGKNVEVLAYMLKRCSSATQLKQLHAHIFRLNLHKSNSLATTLLSLYASFSLTSYAHFIFTSASHPNLFLFNHAIRALSKDPPLCFTSLRLYRQMICTQIRPDNFTYPFLLNSCASLPDLNHGTEIHGRIVRTGFCSYLPVFNALIDMYGKCNELILSRKAFNEMGGRDIVSYNALLGAHARVGEDMLNAQKVFDQMDYKSQISWNAMIVGYVNSGDLDSARALFDKMPDRNIVSWTTMLVGYTKKGLIDLASHLFEAIPERNLIIWTAMISGCAQHGRPREALEYFQRMEKARLRPDSFTMTAVISSLSQLGRADLANWIGTCVDKEGIERNERVLTAMVDMHAKCGNLEEACRLFEEIHRPDVYPYSALITGLASHGHGFKALELFKRMQAEKVNPDYITFMGVFTACTHTGLVEDGLRYWEIMVADYGIEPDASHYACIVDMLGRAGRLDEAYKWVRAMPMGPGPGALGALLAACKIHGNVEIAENVAEQLFEMEPKNTGNFVLLSSIYASNGQWDKAESVREGIKARRVTKLPGCSWVEVDRKLRATRSER